MTGDEGRRRRTVLDDRPKGDGIGGGGRPEAGGGPGGSGGSGGSARHRRALWPVLGSIVLIGVLFLAVFPTRTYLSQRKDMDEGQRRLHVIEEQNAKLEERVKALNTDAEIERLAREQYNLVRPGEESYAILPAPSSPVTLPDVWPFRELDDKLLGRSTGEEQSRDDERAKSDAAPDTTTTTTTKAADDN